MGNASLSARINAKGASDCSPAPFSRCEFFIGRPRAPSLARPRLLPFVALFYHLFRKPRSIGVVPSAKINPVLGSHQPNLNSLLNILTRATAYPWSHLVLYVGDLNYVGGLNLRVALLHYYRQQEDSRATPYEVPQYPHCGRSHFTSGKQARIKHERGHLAVTSRFPC